MEILEPARLRGLLEAAHDGILLLGEDRLLFANTGAASLLGYESGEELVGRPWHAFFSTDQQRHLARHVLPQFEATGAYRGDIAATTRDGMSIDLEVTLSRVSDAEILVIGRDNTERRRLERQRKRLLKSLFVAEREQAVSHFAAKVAHDFNNVMAVIMGSALLMRREIGEDAEAMEHAERIAEACAQANALLTELTQTATRSPDAATIDLREALEEAVDLSRAAVGPRVVLLVEMPDEPLLAEARGTAFMEVALTLVANAGDSLPGGKGRISLSLAGVSGEQAAEGPRPAVGSILAGLRYGRLTVSDTGPGLAERADMLFDAFFTDKDEAGDLLGLAVVSRLVEAAGGAIRLRERPGDGSIFEIFWPLLEERVAPAAVAAATDDLDGMSVLVVDDEQAVAQLVTTALERAGAAVVTCSDPVEALAAIRDDPAAWSLLVTDFDMPGLDGAELTRRCRALRPDLPVMLCTAVTAVLRGPGMDQRLFDGIVTKPFKIGDLVAAAAAAIAGRAEGSASSP